MLKGLERDVSVLVEIEKGKLKDLFQRQLDIEQQKLAAEDEEIEAVRSQDKSLDGVVTFSAERDGSY